MVIDLVSFAFAFKVRPPPARVIFYLTFELTGRAIIRLLEGCFVISRRCLVVLLTYIAAKKALLIDLVTLFGANKALFVVFLTLFRANKALFVAFLTLFRANKALFVAS
jgi:hypothetical protein